MRIHEQARHDTVVTFKTKMINVLILEDNPSDAELVVHELHRSGFEPKWIRVDTELEFLAQLTPSIDIILSDFSLPRLDAYRALKLLKGRGLDIPFIVVSGTIGEETAIKTIKEGAADYILKDRLSRLGLAIENAINSNNLRRQQRRTEEELKKSEELHRSLIQSARDAIMTMSTSGTITSLNPAFRLLTGWAPEEWIGRSFFDLLHDDEINLAEVFFQQILKGTSSPVHEYRIRTQAGPYISGEITASPLMQNGRVGGVLCIFRDISERKMFEVQIREAQKLESLGTLAGGIAHDFNNILGIILGYTELLRDMTASDAKRGEYVEYILKAINRGTTVVRQVLAFARKEEVAPSSTQVNDVVTEAAKMLEETIPKIIDIRLALDETIPPASIDGNQFHQVLLNLCVNARDAIFSAEHGDQSHGTIAITTGAVTGEWVKKHHAGAIADNYICVSVADTGGGMDADTKNRIFDPFFTTKERGKGTGLGLAVVYGIVAAHAGFIDVESEPDRGTIFRVYVPVSSVDVKAGWHAADATDVPLRGAETILVIEDEEPLLKLMKLFLESNGYTVLTATDGMMATELFIRCADDISLVLTDVGLPSMGGISVVKKLREVKPSIPALLASGYLTEKQHAEADRLGLGNVIPKPYQPNIVLQRIRETLDAVRR